MTTEVIEWSKAPEDAQYSYNSLWYKVEDGEVFVSPTMDDHWVISIDWCVDDDLSNHHLFIPRPVSSEQPVPAEVETAISTETYSIEPKPPLGLTPKNIWEEQMQHKRRQDIHAAMQRYIEAGKEIPNDWLEELIELNSAIGNVKAQEILVEVGQGVEGGGWVEWGKEEKPDIPDDTIVEKVYSDGDTKTGHNSDYNWFGSTGWDGKPYVVARYRIINEETE